MAQYVNVNGSDIKVASTVEIADDGKSLEIDNETFTVESLYDDIGYLAEVSAHIDSVSADWAQADDVSYLADVSAHIASISADWELTSTVASLKEGIHNALDEITSETTELQLADIVRILYAIKQVVSDTEPAPEPEPEPEP